MEPKVSPPDVEYAIEMLVVPTALVIPYTSQCPPVVLTKAADRFGLMLMDTPGPAAPMVSGPSGYNFSVVLDAFWTSFTNPVVDAGNKTPWFALTVVTR